MTMTMTAPDIIANREPATEALDDLVDAVRQATDTATELAAIRRLREANGIMTVGVTTAEVMQVLKRRRRQGYSMQEISWMVGLSRGHCFNLMAGRKKVPV